MPLPMLDFMYSMIRKYEKTIPGPLAFSSTEFDRTFKFYFVAKSGYSHKNIRADH